MQKPALAGLLIALGLAATAMAAPASTPEVITTEGAVRGLVRDGTNQYLGVPFAAPPVGELRWRPPAAPARRAAVLQATRFGPSCPQGHDIGDFAKPSDTEDCLYLNIYTPTTPSKTPRAVMVWFPGGALFAGAADDYDGAKFARRGDVVLVTLNYRIGVLGFFAHPAIDAEGHAGGNYGIMDQQAALKWVRANIGRFGGDPRRVTIFGQSAGGTAVTANLLAPGSEGLFHRAINQSGARLQIPTRADAEKIGLRFGTDSGCADQSAACLRRLTPQQIVRVQPGHFAGLMVDGDVIPDQPYLAFRMGAFNRVPVIMGVAADEQGFFLAINQEKANYAALTTEGYKAWAAATFGRNAQAVLEAYPPGAKANPSLDEMAAGQGTRSCSVRMLLGWTSPWVPSWGYQFEDRTAPNYLKPQPYAMGAYHTAEILYQFPGFHGGLGAPQKLNAAQEALSDQLIDAWAAFAKRGDPNAPGAGAWPRYDPKRDNVQALDLGGFKTVEGFGAKNNCELFDRIAGL